MLLRGVALAIGLGLVWLLAVQNLLAALAAPLLRLGRAAQKGLPGPNAGSLAAALGSAAGHAGRRRRWSAAGRRPWWSRRTWSASSRVGARGAAPP